MQNSRSKAYIVIKVVEIVLTGLMIFVILTAIRIVRSSSGASGRERLETAVRKSALNCYAMEGVYPPDLQYLKDHYGLQVDEEKYTVHYTIFAENIMPEVTVTENTK